jgi:hypothetical protein
MEMVMATGIATGTVTEMETGTGMVMDVVTETATAMAMAMATEMATTMATEMATTMATEMATTMAMEMATATMEVAVVAIDMIFADSTSSIGQVLMFRLSFSMSLQHKSSSMSYSFNTVMCA